MTNCETTRLIKKMNAHLTDLYNKFNDVNLQLQDDGLNLIKTRNIVTAVIGKLSLYKQNLGQN